MAHFADWPGVLMFGSIGGFEIIALLAIALLVFGPRRLPEVGRWVARGLNELRKAAAEVKSAVESEADLSEMTRVAGDLKRAVNTEARRLFTDLEEEASLPALRREAPPLPSPTSAREAGSALAPEGERPAATEEAGPGPEEPSHR